MISSCGAQPCLGLQPRGPLIKTPISSPVVQKPKARVSLRAHLAGFGSRPQTLGVVAVAWRTGPVPTSLLCADLGALGCCGDTWASLGEVPASSAPVPRGQGCWVNPGGARDGACTPRTSGGEGSSVLTEAPAHISSVGAVVVGKMGAASCHHAYALQRHREWVVEPVGLTQF